MGEQDKHGQEINVGDHVYTKIRGGHREGEVSIYKWPIMDNICNSSSLKVEQVVETQEEAKEAGVKNPPKVRTWTYQMYNLWASHEIKYLVSLNIVKLRL
jgi:predicted HAD superfamily phosphohydrolase YqeG